MRKVGIIGGIGPASTLDYYAGIINGYRHKANSTNYPEIIIYSINMAEMISYIEKDRWDKVIFQLAGAIKSLDAAGADFVVIASNTPHLVFDEVNFQSPIPVLSIVEETCKFIKKADYQRVLTIGTLFTMKSCLYTANLVKYGISPYCQQKKTSRRFFRCSTPIWKMALLFLKIRIKCLYLLVK